MADIADTYDLSKEIGIKELSLSSGGYTESDESLLVLSNKPDVLKNKEIQLRYAKKRDWESSKPEAFYAEAGVFNQRELLTSWSQLAKDGWSFKVHRDPDGNSTSKKYYVRIENSNSNQVYMGVPVTRAHFTEGLDPVLDDLLIIDEQSFIDNPNFAMSLNHQRIKVESNDGRWTVAKDDILAGRIKLPGNTSEANNPEEIYLLTESEIGQYNSTGARKGWREQKEESANGTKSKNGLRTFVKEELKNGGVDRIDRRFAREIMIPQMVNGEETPVKHYLLSDKNTLESIEIMDTTSLKESVAQENTDDTVSQPRMTAEAILAMSESTVFAEKIGGSAVDEKEEILESQVNAEPQDKAEVQNKAADQDQPPVQEPPDDSDFIVFEDQFAPEKNISKPGEAKATELTGMALELADRIRDENDGTLSITEKGFLDDINGIQDNQEELQKALARIQNSPEHANIIKQLGVLSKQSKTPPEDESKDVSIGSTGSNDPADPAKTTVNGVEAAAGLVTGLAGGAIQGVAALGQGVAYLGALGFKAASTVIENHQKRKQYRLDHPEVVEQERAASKERLMVARRAVAEDSNRILDAKIESVIASKQYIDENPAVQQMNQMIEDNPDMRDNLQGWLKDTAKGNPVFAEHLKNIQKNAGGVARTMEENLKLNNLAEGDLQERKVIFEKFNEKFSNDSLADALPDAGIETPDGEQPVTIRESITKAINNMMKMLKDMMLRLLGKKKEAQDESVGQNDDTAPAMSR